VAFTALLSAIGGYGQGRQQRTENQRAATTQQQQQQQLDLTKSYQQQQNDNQQAELARQLQSDAVTASYTDAQLLNMGYKRDPQTGKVVALPAFQIPANLQPGAKNPDGTPMPEYQRLAGIAQAAELAGRPDAATFWSGQGTSDANNLSKYYAGLNNQAKTTEIPSIIAFNKARTDRLYSQSKIDMARVNEAWRAADARTRAMMQVAQTNAQSRAAAAGLGYQGRVEAGLIAGYYMMQTHNMDDASRQAVAAAADAERFAGAAVSATKDPNAGLQYYNPATPMPAAPAPVYQAPQFTVMMPGAAPPSAQPGLRPPPVTQQQPSAPPQQPPPAPAPMTAEEYQSALSSGVAAVKQDHTQLAGERTAIQALLKQKRITPQQAAQALAQLQAAAITTAREERAKQAQQALGNFFSHIIQVNPNASRPVGGQP